VLNDAAGVGADEFVLGGDYVVLGARPVETLERLRSLKATWIRGNTDRWLVDASDAPDNALVERALAYSRQALGEALCAELGALPATATLEHALVCHASPRSDMLSFSPEPSGSDRELLEPTDPEMIMFGHTHLQFERELDGRLLVNPGSVGMPFDGDQRAAYALWHGGREVELRRVGYDAEAYARELHERLTEALGDTVETLVRRVEQAAFVS
jgi:diadenosine tetraphosphatase ApaH/serine/threonine PP2A family protein phosphatase